MGVIIQHIPIFDKPGADPQEKPEKRMSPIGLALLSFSFQNNITKLFEVSNKGDNDLKVLNGIRVFSMAWIVVGHAFMIFIGTPLTNAVTAMQTLDPWYFVLIPGGYFAVDVFFFMAGFLTFYLLTSKMYPRNGKANYPMLYFHRWFRLFTPAGFTMLITNFVFEHFGTHPEFHNHWNMNCKRYWWSSLLFINTIVPWRIADMCMSWFWYLSNDFQFFLVSPIIILAYCKNRFAGYGLTSLFILFNVVFNMAMTAKHNLAINQTFDNPADFMNIIYMKSWARFAPYGIGGILGFMYYEYKSDVKKEREDPSNIVRPSLSTKIFRCSKSSHLVTYGCLLVGLSITSFLVFIQIDFYRKKLMTDPWNKFSNMLFNGFSRGLFVVGVTLIILPTFQNRLSWIKYLLSSDFMCVLGRLTFSVYLLHTPFQIFFMADIRQGQWINNLNGWWFMLSTLTISFLMAIPFSMYCEVPFMNLEKHFLMPKPASKNEAPKLEKKKEFENLNWSNESDEKSPMCSDTKIN
mmetsp:Transcript_23190/g.25732  ORF Transcript_23190/g.25732 Transcript_23190/m.25732 type:complete len:519 (+) Transcript_23190:580-2136(+)